MPLNWVLVLSTFLFCTGVYGVLARRNAVIVLMSVEIMLNAVNLNFIAFNGTVGGDALVGQIFALFVIAIAAAELGVGLAIVLLIYRNKFTVSLDEVNLLKW